MLLAELQRRGRARRILAVVPRHILDQVQHELWCRAGIPLVRLDSEGIQRLRQRIPSGRNPFVYFDRVIVSIDTIKNPSKYRHYLEKVRWDAVWIDESHKLMNRGTLNNQLAQGTRAQRRRADPRPGTGQLRVHNSSGVAMTHV